MRTLDIYDKWAAAYALRTGVRLLKIVPGQWVRFVFDDSDGEASRALGEWRSSTALVPARSYASAFRQLRRLA